jgi:exopolyphosphatase/guanosine-5'-triphosphate,3'-diphosphate pyrophosphatase
VSASGRSDAAPGARRAAIDIGTNSVLLLIAERDAESWRPVVDRATITRLGQGVDRTRELAPEARERTLAALRDYAELIRTEGVTELDVVGTSAMRDARGGREFAEEAAKVLGVSPRILSGAEEAEVTFVGTLSGLDVDGAVTVFDVGGGSTEIIRGHAGPDTNADAAVSLDIGSVRLFERHVASDPPADSELSRVDADIDAALASAPSPSHGAALVGVAGTVTTLAAIALELESYDGARVHGLRLSRDAVAGVARRLETMTHTERCALAGLEPKRADVIVVGARIVERVIAWAGASELVVSDRGVRWGLLETSHPRTKPI